ncbi:MAG TPA: phosphoribosyltransferase family protein [Methylomirabilota bacterium]|nr:phosphoribosyltransferase family protein [Methylomirabilota bacterium]
MPRRADDPGLPGAGGPAPDAARRAGPRSSLTPGGAPPRVPVGPGPSPTAPRPPVDPAVRERIHLEILRRTGAYRSDDHFLLPSGHHAPEFIDKALVTTEPSFTEGLGDVIASHFAAWPVDVVLSTGPGALILAHCVARALPSRPILVYATKGFTEQGRQVRLPDEFTRFVRPGSKVLVIEDLITTGETIKLLIRMVRDAGGTVMGIGCLWQRASKSDLGREVFSLVHRDFPTYDPASCPLCARGVPLNVEFARAEPPTEDAADAGRRRRP